MRNIGISNPVKTEVEEPGEESKEASMDEGPGNVSHRTTDKFSLPGEVERAPAQFDNIIIACSPYPTNKADQTLPRYLTSLKQVDCENEKADPSDLIQNTYRSYFEGCKFQVLDDMSTSQNCIWLKPEFNCPQGATMWVAS